MDLLEGLASLETRRWNWFLDTTALIDEGCNFLDSKHWMMNAWTCSMIGYMPKFCCGGCLLL